MLPLEIPYLKIVQQAQQTPSAIAVLQGDVQLTYEQLNRRASQVAQYLRRRGVQRNSRVGIMTQRGPLMVIGILGILKAGGAYVPLDPDYPADRIRYILDHAEIELLLSEQALATVLPSCLAAPSSLKWLLLLDSGDPVDLGPEVSESLTQVACERWSTEAEDAPEMLPDPDDLMVVLYTSGSTGRPKGVMLNHRGYMNRLTWMQKTFQLRLGDRVAQKTSFCFDISVWELFWPLMEGATICPVQRDVVLNPWDFAAWMKTYRISIMHFVPSLFGEFIHALANESWQFPDLRWLIFSGEALPAAFIQQWIDRQGLETGLANLYGPTEASIDVTAHLIQARPARSIPIGKAIDNAYICILDEQMQPVPAGKMGELWIGGVQLAKGYLKDPERTASAFQPNPFTDIPGETLYRSGDLAKELPDGSFEYHGRIDSQIKIRGFRVELGEIENVLTLHPAIQEAAVLAVDYDAGQKRLVAWVSGETIPARSLKLFLAKKLPHYMIPQRIEWLKSLPKNHNGKLDRKALLNNPAELVIASPPKIDPDSFPLAPAQRWIVRYFTPPYQWAGYTRFRYQKTLDIELLNQAFNQMVEQHPALRTVVVQQNNQWQQRLLPPTPVNIAVADGSYFAPEQRDRYCNLKIQQTLQTLRLDQGPLFSLSVMKVHETCYDITIVAHHMIADLLAGGILFNRLWQAYDRLCLGADPAASSSSDGYLSYIQCLQTAEQQGALVTHLDYWKSQFPTAEAAFKIPCDRPHTTDANTEAAAKSVCFQLTAAATETLLADAKQHYQCSVYGLLLAPLYKLLAQWAQQDWVVVSHRSHGRDLGNGQVFWQSFGNYAVNFPIGLTVDATDDWQRLIQQIAQQFDDLPMNGVTYDWLGDQLPDHLYPDEKLTLVRANYLGNRSLPTSDTFEFVQSERDRRLALPNQKRTALLEFFFAITDGVLQLEIEYSKTVHSGHTIQQLGEQYLTLMHSLIALPVSVSFSR